METRWNYEYARTIQNNSTYVSSSKKSNGNFWHRNTKTLIFFELFRAMLTTLHQVEIFIQFSNSSPWIENSSFSILTWINNCSLLFLAIKINRNEMNSEKNKSSILESFERETWDKFFSIFFLVIQAKFFFPTIRKKKSIIQSNESGRSFSTWQMMRVNRDWN